MNQRDIPTHRASRNRGSADGCALESSYGEQLIAALFQQGWVRAVCRRGVDRVLRPRSIARNVGAGECSYG